LSKSEAKKEIAEAQTQSEKKVGNLFLDMGFNFIAIDSEIRKDGQSAKLGEIDLIFTFDDYVFLIEINGEKKAGSKKINDFFSKWNNTENLELIRKKHNFGPLNPIRLYFELTKNSDDTQSPAIDHSIEISSNALIFADDFDYFQKYVNKIGTWAKNDLLHFIGIKNKEDTRIINAIQFYIGDTAMFSFVERVDTLLNSCYVSRRRDKQEGYQRTLSQSRIKSISNVIISGQGLTFPNSILINTPTLKDIPTTPGPRPELVKIKFPTGY